MNYWKEYLPESKWEKCHKIWTMEDWNICHCLLSNMAIIASRPAILTVKSIPKRNVYVRYAEFSLQANNYQPPFVSIDKANLNFDISRRQW